MDDQDQKNFQVIFEDKTFTIPKSVLISLSAYFESLFNTNCKEISQNFVEIKEFDAIAFELVIEYVMNGSMKIKENAKNLINGFKCACYLQICEVQKFCEKEIIPEINIKNCLEIYKVASQRSFLKLANAAMTCAAWNCKAIFNLSSFLEEPLEVVCEFLRRPELNVHGKNEWIVWEESIYPWIMKDEENRKPDLLNLLTCIDYTNLNLDDIVNMMNYYLVSDNVIVTEFLNWILKLLKEKELININHIDYINSLSCSKEIKSSLKSVFSKTNAVKRFYPVVPWFVAFEVIDDDLRGRRSTNPIILSYDCESNTVTEFLPLSKLSVNATFCVGFRVCSVGYCFYILGGQYQIGSSRWNNDVWSFDTVTQKWEVHEKLPEKRRNHMMCVVDSVIYLIGGYGNHRIALSSMDAYDTINRTWQKKVPDAPFNGSGSCCVYNQTILVFFEDMLHTYNVKSKKWLSDKVYSTEARSYVTAVCHNDLVYLLRSYSNEVYTTNPFESRINIKYFGSFQNNTENVCIVNDTLFSFTVDRNLKNPPINDTINIIEVIPLSEESEKKYEALSKVQQNSTQQDLSNENDLNEVDEEKDTSVGHEVEPEYKEFERYKLNVEANHSQHSLNELKQDYLKKKKILLEQNLPTNRPATDEDLEEESIKHMHLQETQRVTSPGEQHLNQSSLKRGIQIWNSKDSKSVLSNIPFTTGSSCHGCSTLFKIEGTLH